MNASLSSVGTKNGVGARDHHLSQHAPSGVWARHRSVAKYVLSSVHCGFLKKGFRLTPLTSTSGFSYLLHYLRVGNELTPIKILLVSF